MSAESQAAVVNDAVAIRGVLDRVAALHQPQTVPAAGGANPSFVRCSCTPGLYWSECATVRALQGYEGIQ